MFFKIDIIDTVEKRICWGCLDGLHHISTQIKYKTVQIISYFICYSKDPINKVTNLLKFSDP
jgi:hypothetical protein